MKPDNMDIEKARKHNALRFMQELQRDLERNARVTKLLTDCHKRISHSTPQWGDRDLLQRISEEVMEAGK
jgi:hypothetical protein